ncbi:MAG: acetyl-CoA carboxylase carboxyltransferase subunit alpha [Candidatus Omnitrophica bacterium]|nr:acetyl-CoA carboxylase carboxyltransferase subunit alpha [Candidatus Omnitrophota bacterium]MDD5737022.1 acetyl-CoA carboxylase carboxyltransferase subunit alpha [Candidatus Omnitrophota bacterium]
MNGTGLDFEKPILELERKIEELKKFTSSENIDLSSEIKKLEDKLDKVKREVFESLSPWQRVQIARHPKRPYTLDYINLMMTDFCEVHGDRVFGDDKALICGFAKIDEQKVVVMGHQKGRDTKENLMRNFGSAHPEGYRKAMRLMHMGEKFNLPIVVFIDTPGAYPGIGAEERGQAEAIALNLMEMARLKVPIVCYIIGEGGSGGALGVGIGDRICVLENAYYSVISPEGCAAILWKDRTRAPDAAKALKLTAQDLFDLGLIDEVVREPLGGAHRDPARIAETIKESAKRHLKELSDMQPEDLVEARYEKYRKIGAFSTE